MVVGARVVVGASVEATIAAGRPLEQQLVSTIDSTKHVVVGARKVVGAFVEATIPPSQSIKNTVFQKGDRGEAKLSRPRRADSQDVDETD